MKICWILALLCFGTSTFALSGAMEKATVHSMRKVPCMEAQIGGDCLEYELRTTKVSYTIRPRRAILLLLGSDVAITLAGSELLLRAGESAKEKGIRCDVLAMSLRSDVERQEKERERSRPLPVRCYAESGREIRCPDEPYAMR